MDVKSLHVQSVACPRMRTLVLQTMDFQSIVVDLRTHLSVDTTSLPRSGRFIDHFFSIRLHLLAGEDDRIGHQLVDADDLVHL